MIARFELEGLWFASLLVYKHKVVLSVELLLCFLLQGVYQYVPAKGEGFPEDFVPFTKMDHIVNAKY